MPNIDDRKLRLCFIASAHSVHIKKFIDYFVRSGHDVTVITPDLCLYQIPGVKIVNIRDLTNSEKVRRALRDIHALHRLRDWKTRANAEIRHAFLKDRYLSESATAQIAREDEGQRIIWNAAIQQITPVVNKIVAELKPDIVQSLRFYPEGLIAAGVDHPRKSFFVWGSDLSGFATWYPEVGDMTRVAFQRCAGLLHDNAKDYRFSLQFGLPANVPHIQVPSNGGIDTRLDPPRAPGSPSSPEFATIRRMGNLFMNNEPVVRAVALLHSDHNLQTKYTLYAKQFGPYYDRVRVLAKKLGIWKSLRFEGPYAPNTVYQTIERCLFQVSPAVDDGTSAALLETMWCGAIPIYSDVESIREWIVDGSNGYLFDMNDPAHIAKQMLRAWQEKEDRRDLVARNQTLVRERADYGRSMEQVLNFYYSLL